MARVTDPQPAGLRPVIVVDVSPPRGAGAGVADEVGSLDADFMAVAYAPGRSVRADPAFAAYLIRERTGREVVFNLAARDMNRLAIQSHLVGASLLGLRNVVLLRGDPLSDRDGARTREVKDAAVTDLIRGARRLNEGLDFRGARLQVPTDLCVGATVDLNRDVERQAELVGRKVRAGAQFLIGQPCFDPGAARRFHQAYRRLYGKEVEVPVFYGVQVPSSDGPAFGPMPDGVRAQLERGRSGVAIAEEAVIQWMAEGYSAFYLVPPILARGKRDYEAAQRVVEKARGRAAAPAGARRW